MSNEPLLTDDDIDEIASGYTGNPRDVGIFTSIEVRNRYETELNSLRGELRTLHSHLAQVCIRLAQLEAEAERNRGEL